MPIQAVYEAIEAENPFELFPELTEELLIEAHEKGEARRAESTKLDAPTRGGSEAFFERLRVIRVGLIPHKWGYSNERNYCTTISPDGRHQIAVAAGTWGTGMVDRTPETARSMGPVTAAMIGANTAQLDLFGVATKEPPKVLTWLFLSYREWRRGGSRIYSELSLPEAMTESGVVYKWRQRYVVTRFDLKPTPFDNYDWDDGGDGPEGVDVSVSLKR